MSELDIYRIICGALLLLLCVSQSRKGYFKGRYLAKDDTDGWEDEALWWRQRYENREAVSLRKDSSTSD